MVRTFLKVYMELGSYFFILQEQIKDIIIKIDISYLHIVFHTYKRYFILHNCLFIRTHVISYLRHTVSYV
jgi:hypothetical protein